MVAVKRTVRSAMEWPFESVRDVDCSVDMDTGEELPSMTKQSFRDECDINTIMRRYETTGEITHLNRRNPEYGDFTDVKTFHEAMNIVQTANQAFSDLPASVRDRFGNDPAKMLEFLQNPENVEEAIKLGLLVRRDEPPKDPVADGGGSSSPPPPQPKAGDSPASGKAGTA